MSKNKAGKQPLQDAAQPDNRPLSLGYSIKGLAKPGDFEHTDMFPGINLNHNIEKGYKQSFDDMIDMFGRLKPRMSPICCSPAVTYQSCTARMHTL